MAQVEQIGGSHYKAQYQHWDYCKDTNMGYLEGNATKYLMRWDKKNGLEDLRKSLSYVKKLMVGNEYAIRVPPTQSHLFERMCDENGVGDMERVIMYSIFHWQSYANLELAREQLIGYIRTQEEYQETLKAFNGEPTSAYTNQGK